MVILIVSVGSISADRTNGFARNGKQIIEGLYTPKNQKCLLAIGQDLLSLSEYRSGGLPEPGGAVAYTAFYCNLSTDYNINYGALGMDNSGNLTGVDTDWGAGPLNAASTADGWKQSLLIIALSITEHWDGGGMSRISSGQCDANIDKLSLFCNKYKNKRIYLRIGYEFDGRWNGPEVTGYGTSNESPNPGGYHKHAEYIAAYRHIVDKMRAAGVDNVAYVWQSSASLIDDVLDAWYDNGGDIAAARENIKDWYPGDDYVDWMGISWFISPPEADDNFGFADVPGLPNQDDLADEMIKFAREKRKPVMIAESTPQGYDFNFPEATEPNQVSRVSTGWPYEGAKTLLTQGLEQAQAKYEAGTWFENITAEVAWDRWFVPYLRYIHDNSDVVRAVVYINCNWNTQFKWSFNEEVGRYVEGYWGDTRIEANQVIKDKWLAEINTDFWLLGSDDINNQIYNVVAIETPHTINSLKGYSLAQNVPNPIINTTTIHYNLPKKSHVAISVHTLNGKLVQPLINAVQQPGVQKVDWDASTIPAGVYLYKIQAGAFSKTMKCVVKR